MFQVNIFMNVQNLKTSGNHLDIDTKCSNVWNFLCSQFIFGWLFFNNDEPFSCSAACRWLDWYCKLDSSISIGYTQAKEPTFCSARNWAVHWFLIKSRIQADSPENRKYPTSISVLSKTLKEDGHQVLWKGLGPCLLRSIPVCAILFTVQTMSSDFLRDFYSINKNKAD